MWRSTPYHGGGHQARSLNALALDYSLACTHVVAQLVSAAALVAALATLWLERRRAR